MKKKLEIGEVVTSSALAEAINGNVDVKQDVYFALERFRRCDWGVSEPESRDLNDNAVKYNNNRIMAMYPTCEGDIFITTDQDRSHTTMIFCKEY